MGSYYFIGAGADTGGVEANPSVAIAGTAAAPGYAIRATNLGIWSSAANTLDFTTSGVTNWQISSAGHLLATDNTFDIGASAATRPRDLWLARNAAVGGTLGVTGVFTASSTSTHTGDSTFSGNILPASTSLITWATRSKLSSSADGVVVITNNAATAAATIAHRRTVTATATNPYNITALETESVATTATDTLIFQLPASAAALAGVHYTFINTAANGGALMAISPGASDSIYGTVGAITASGTANKDWQNTKVTGKKGDYTTLVCDGGTGWYIIGGVGVWASES